MIMTKVRESEKHLKELKREKLIQTITNEWGFTYSDGKFNPTCHYSGFWYKDLGNDTFLIICYACNRPDIALYIFDLFRCVYPANAKLGYSKPLWEPQKLKLGIDLGQDKQKIEKVLRNPIEITESELWEE